MNLVSRYSVRDPNVLASIASESQGNTKSESQNVPLSSLNVQQTSTGRSVMGASSSDWNKHGETRIWQVCNRWWYGLWHRHRIEPFSKITLLPEQSEWSIAKDIGPFFKRCNARHRQTFHNFVECLCLRHWKHLSSWERITPTNRENPTLKQMFEISEKLILEQSDEIFGVSQISWEILHGSSYLWSMMKKSSVSRL